MSDPQTPTPPPPRGEAPASRLAGPPPARAGGPAGSGGRYLATLACLIGLVAAVLAAAALWTARGAQQRLQGFEPEIVRRQQQSETLAGEARALAKQAQDGALDAAAKVSLVEARVADVAVQRGQLDELIQSLSRSRDESVLTDVESAIRMATQQSSIMGSAAPLVATLQQADERLARYSEPRLDVLRRAIASDIERLRGVGAVDVSLLNVRLDEAVRMIDGLPLVSQAARGREGRPAPGSPASEVAVAPPHGSADEAASAALAASAVEAEAAQAAASAAPAGSGWGWGQVTALAERWGAAVWGEFRSLLRVSRIDNPEAMLVAPEEGYFLRENLKLRLLNARLAVLSRQFESAQSDLQIAQASLDRYFDRSSRKVAVVGELLREVALQARETTLPRPDQTLSVLASLSATGAGR